MQTINSISYGNVEVTPEEEEAWHTFLIKFADKPIIEINYETEIPKEEINGLLKSGN